MRATLQARRYTLGEEKVILQRRAEDDRLRRGQNRAEDSENRNRNESALKKKRKEELKVKAQQNQANENRIHLSTVVEERWD